MHPPAEGNGFSFRMTLECLYDNSGIGDHHVLTEESSETLRYPLRETISSTRSTRSFIVYSESRLTFSGTTAPDCQYVSLHVLHVYGLTLPRPTS